MALSATAKRERGGACQVDRAQNRSEARDAENENFETRDGERISHKHI